VRVPPHSALPATASLHAVAGPARQRHELARPCGRRA
jgi:hypothetical protein